MVHALNEIHRVVVNNGVLIDLRPRLDKWPIEIVSIRGYQDAGHVTDLPESLADDEAANAAMMENSKSGWFRGEREEIFPFFYYWDTPKEMQAYIAENWDDVIGIEDATWETIRSAWAIANADARVRLRMKLLITRWQRINP